MFGAILSSFNSVLNSASTMFTLDLYRSSINPQASDTKCVKVGKISNGTIAGCVAIVISNPSPDLEQRLHDALE